MARYSQDDLLTAGYFRSGHTYRRTRFIFVDGAMYSTVWSRVALATYALRKSQRKLWRRTLRRFRYEVGPYRARDDQDRVYHFYQAAHPLDVGRTVRDVLGHHAPEFDFDTHAVRVYDGDALVGFSCFDVHRRSLASLFACYLPEYRRHSLGIFTMLAELDHGRALGLEHYHPGYCVPGLAAFAYKERLPDLEGRPYGSEAWAPMSEVLAEALPHERLTARVDDLARALAGAGVPHARRYLPLCEMGPMVDPNYGAMPEPVMLELTGTNALGEVFASYNLAEGRYEVYFGQAVADLRFEPDFDELRAQVPPDSNLRLYENRRLLLAAPELDRLVPLLAPRSIVALILRRLPLWALDRRA